MLEHETRIFSPFSDLLQREVFLIIIKDVCRVIRVRPKIAFLWAFAGINGGKGVKFASSLGISSPSAGTAIIVAIQRAPRSKLSTRVQFLWSFRSFMVLGRKGYFIHFRRQLVRW